MDAPPIVHVHDVASGEPWAGARTAGLDRLLVLLFALTTVDLSVSVVGVHVGLGDALLIPAVLLILAYRGNACLNAGYFCSAFAYITWAFLSLFWSGDIKASVPPVIQYAEFTLATVLAFAAIGGVKAIRGAVDAYLVCAGLLSVAVISYAVWNRSYTYVYLLNYQKNYLGSIVGNALPLIVGLLISRPESRSRLVPLLTINLVALLMSTSRGAILGAVLGVVVTLLAMKRLRYLPLLTIGSALLYLIFSRYVSPDYGSDLTQFGVNSSAYSRVVTFKSASAFIEKHFFFGGGAGSFHVSLPSIGFEQNDPNNVFLLNMAELGLVGTTIFTLVLIAILRVGWKGRSVHACDPATLGLVAGLAGAFVSHLVHIQVDVAWVRGTGTFMFACVGMLIRLASIPARDIGTVE